jgi:hypothetical protein
VNYAVDYIHIRARWVSVHPPQLREQYRLEKEKKNEKTRARGSGGLFFGKESSLVSDTPSDFAGGSGGSSGNSGVSPPASSLPRTSSPSFGLPLSMSRDAQNIQKRIKRPLDSSEDSDSGLTSTTSEEGGMLVMSEGSDIQ